MDKYTVQISLKSNKIRIYPALKYRNTAIAKIDWLQKVHLRRDQISI